jgi:ribonuclease E
MLDEESNPTTATTERVDVSVAEPPAEAGSNTKKPAKKAAAKKSAAKKTTKKSARAPRAASAETDDTVPASETTAAERKSARKTAAKSSSKTRATKKKTPAEAGQTGTDRPDPVEGAAETDSGGSGSGAVGLPLFQAPDPAAAAPRAGSKKSAKASAPDDGGDEPVTTGEDAAPRAEAPDDEQGSTRRRRSRGGRNRRKASGDEGGTTEAKAEGSAQAEGSAPDSEAGTEDDGGSSEDGATSHRRRRRRRSGDDGGGGHDDPASTTTKVRRPRAKKESITSVEGSTRIEAKKQRRREGREAGRRRPPILSESEFLARRESVERVMAIRQRGETTQIAVLEDNVLVEHYVALESQNSIIGNVYLGRVQNVLPSMEAAFIDIGKGRNAVLYAGEVNWNLREDTNQPRRIENALKPGQSLLVQVSKDPVGHKGARLTSQISLPGRYLVYVPGGGTSGISRKLPDTERNRLKNLLKDILPEEAGVIIRTAAEGASEEELTRDVTRLTARWEDIDKKTKNGQAPQLLYAEPDTTLKVVRDLFTEDFSQLLISGDDAWDMVDAYVQHVAPDLVERLEHYEGDGDVFKSYRIDEQITKALDRKVWLPSGGSLVIDRTEAMTVVDVNTGKFTGSGGNLEETVTKNNLEAAEEIVRQLRLRDIGGIIVIDFIDMVLENNRDLVLRRLVECLGRDRTRHQVAEVTSLGLVQMTRKRISTGLLEAFSHPCEHCQGRGVLIEGEPVEPKRHEEHHHGPGGSRGGSKRSSNRRRGGKRGDDGQDTPDDGGSLDDHVQHADHDDQEAPASSSDGPDQPVRPETTVETQPTEAAPSTSPAEPQTVAPETVAPDAGSSQQDDALPSHAVGREVGTSRGRRRRRASRPTGAPTSAGVGSQT